LGGFFHFAFVYFFKLLGNAMLQMFVSATQQVCLQWHPLRLLFIGEYCQSISVQRKEHKNVFSKPISVKVHDICPNPTAATPTRGSKN
jgi:hypothetical protein